MSISRNTPWLATAAMTLAGLAPWSADAVARSLPMVQPEPARITRAVDDAQRIVLKGSRPALALAKYDIGPLPASRIIRNVTLLLKRSAARQAQFEGYLAELTRPGSPYFHHWLTAQQIGSRFGPEKDDIAVVEQWLQSQGLHVDSASPTGMMISFSGTAASVGRAFHTSLHGYTVNSENHFGNAGEQQIPAALAPVVVGAASLGNFFPKPQHTDVGTVRRDRLSGKWKAVAQARNLPQITVPPGTLDPQTTYDVAPQDFNTIYNVTPLWNRSTPLRGAGQSVAVLERTDVLPADIQTFRQAFLPGGSAGTVNYINPAQYAGDTSCVDPGTNGDEGEAALDAEWAGAAAPDATIVFASCDDSNSATFGAFTAAENLLSGYAMPVPGIFSLSYGDCEADGLVDGSLGQAGDLWSQAAAEGVTVFVSSGDAGSAGCSQNQAASFQGIAVNGMAATVYNVAVGGTDFDDFNKQGQYWSASNSTLFGSALGYIPEQAWNSSCASSKLDALLGFSNGVQACNDPKGQQFLNTGGGSGGPSTVWSNPLSQVGIYGMDNYGARTLPDVSLFAANGIYGHALVFCMSDPAAGGTTCDYSNPDDVLFNSAGGTSFAAPAMAGVQALINQSSGQSSGNVLPALYTLGSKEYGTPGSPNTAMLDACDSSKGTGIASTCVFNNVTAGDIDEPCFGGTSDCYTGAAELSFGVLSGGGFDLLDPAWSSHAGYNMATGLGSINATNLVDALTRFYAPYKQGYVAPSDYLSSAYESQGDGFSDIAVLEPVKHSFLQLGMKGSLTLNNVSQAMPAGYSIGAIGNFFALNNGVFGASQYIDSIAWMGPGNQLTIWLSDGLGGIAANGASNYYPAVVGDPYAAGWAIAGAGNFDNIGSDELFLWNSHTGQVQWQTLTMHAFFVLGHPHYIFNSSFSAITDGPVGFQPRLADVNGDGYADIVWTSTHASNLSVYVSINNQQGGFDTTQTADHPAGFSLFGAGDVTGDGVTSLFWSNAVSNQLLLWHMDGSTVASHETLAVPAGYSMASLADFDGDGLADILWTSRAQVGKVAIGPAHLQEWLNDGRGGFITQSVADLDGKLVSIPAGAQVQANRLQGGRVTSGVDTSVGISH